MKRVLVSFVKILNIIIRAALMYRVSKQCSWTVTGLGNDTKLVLDEHDHLKQFGIIQSLQRSPILQTSNWSGTFFETRYSKVALVIQVLNQRTVFD